MLRLRQQVRRHITRIRCLVRKDKDLARPRVIQPETISRGRSRLILADEAARVGTRAVQASSPRLGQTHEISRHGRPILRRELGGVLAHDEIHPAGEFVAVGQALHHLGRVVEPPGREMAVLDLVE